MCNNLMNRRHCEVFGDVRKFGRWPDHGPLANPVRLADRLKPVCNTRHSIRGGLSDRANAMNHSSIAFPQILDYTPV
jgi:hypothetical protein